jgi:hypothetical protein
LILKLNWTLLTNIKKGKSVQQLNASFQIKEDTIRNILRHANESIRFYQMRATNVPISYNVIHIQALRMNAMLGENSEPGFIASNGFIHKFLARHGFNNSERLYGERISADPASAEDFKQELRDYITKHDLCAEQIFNCDESGLFYKAIPNRSLLTPEETQPSNIKDIKDRVTILLCADASGNFKLPLVFIHKYQTPHCLRNINKANLPVDYHVQSSAWMDSAVFERWFKEDLYHLLEII